MKEKYQVLNLFSASETLNRVWFSDTHPPLQEPYTSLQYLNLGQRSLALQMLVWNRPSDEVKRVFTSRKKRRIQKNRKQIFQPDLIKEAQKQIMFTLSTN